MIWCFVKGFSYTIGVAAGLILFVFLNAKFHVWMVNKRGFHGQDVLLGQLVFYLVMTFGTLVSLTLCGVLQ